MELTLYPKQGRCLTTPANEVLYGGAAGGGKSHLLRAASVVFCMGVPGLHVYLFRRTFKELINNHIHTPGGYLEMLDPLMKQKLVNFNKSEYAFEWKNGSRIQMCHAQWENDIYNYLGAQIPLLLIDEATRFTEKMVRLIRSRVRLGSLKVPETYKHLLPRIIYASNPGGVAHRYFKRNFVDHGEKVHKAPRDEGGMRRQYIPAKLRDNIMLMKTDPDYGDRLYGLGTSSLVDAMLDGNWDMSDNSALKDWDNAIHVVRPFKIPRGWEIKRGYDYGYTAPYAVLWAAISNGEEFLTESEVLDEYGNVVTIPQRRSVPRGSTFIIRELYGADKYGQGIKEDVTATAEKVNLVDRELGGSVRVRPGPADNAIFNKEQGPSIAEMMATKAVFWNQSNKTPGSRVNGLATLNQMVTNATRQHQEAPGFYVFDTCVETVAQLPYLETDEDMKEDINDEQPDHIYDVVRYLVLDVSQKIQILKVQGL